MSSALYDKIVSQRGSLENLIAKIPGFKGYHEKNARRHADRLLREHISAELDRRYKRFEDVEREVLDLAGGLMKMTDTRRAKTKLRTYRDRVYTAAPKYDGMFAQLKIGNKELDEIYAFDEAQVNYISLIDIKLDALAEAVGKDNFDKALDEFVDVVNEADDAFDLRDNVITGFEVEG
ncbi:MAG: hypothetical protein MUF38_00485 [Anaerolineae bacterium]|jgi:hypothetical protein|nr:hypothetical protein [Anaerolineae bacterium]